MILPTSERGAAADLTDKFRKPDSKSFKTKEPVRGERYEGPKKCHNTVGTLVKVVQSDQ